MAEEEPTDPRHPRLQMHGPKADVPIGAAAGELPFASGRFGAGGGGGPSRRALVVLGVLAALLAGIGLGAWLAGGGSDDGPSAVPTGSAAGPSTTPVPRGSSTTTTTSSATTTTTTAAATTTTAPVTTTTISPTAKIPVEFLPRHEAVYRDGKLVLQGTVPSAEIRTRFQQEAAAVIGKENVLVRYRIDPRVPVPTDGRVRVDEDFLFATGSAAIEPQYEPILQLGVTVMRLNPNARMRVLGYTDSTGSAAANQRLSQTRADAIRAYLAANGIAAGRIEAIGRGPADPVAPNDTPANRSRNRRIEVELLDLLK